MLPEGVYPGAGAFTVTKLFRKTGEFRAPKQGEFYLSGAIVAAYEAPNDLTTAFHIAKEVKLQDCPHCAGTGKVVSP